MTWQDIVLTCGGVLFVVALVPTLCSADKPHIHTSLLTGFVLCAFAVAYASLGLTFATVTTAITAGLWLVIAIQTLKNKRLTGV